MKLQENPNTLSLNRGQKPKKAQALLGKNLTYYTIALIHRQYGKTECIANIVLSILLNPKIRNPSGIIYSATFSNVKKYYLNRLRDMVAVFKPSFDHISNTLSWVKDVDKYDRRNTATILFGGAQDDNKSNRGGTGHILAGDEWGDWSRNYAETVFFPMGDVHSAYKLMSGTPRGPNHFKNWFKKAEHEMFRGNKDYYALRWTIEDSLREGEVSQEFYDRKRVELSGDLKWVWDTEYMMDFDASTPGRVFASYINEAYEKRRIGRVILEPHHPVETVWDLGVNGTVCLFRQVIGGKHVYFKDLRELKHCNFQKFCSEKVIPYIYGNNLTIDRHIFPHDINRRELLSPESRLTVAQNLLKGRIEPLKAFRKKDEAVDKTCRTFDRCFFDEEGCNDLITDLSLVVYENGDFVKKGENSELTHAPDAFVLGENYGEHVDPLGIYDESGSLGPSNDEMRMGYENWCRKMRKAGLKPDRLNQEHFAQWWR